MPADQSSVPHILGSKPADYAGDVSADEAWRVLAAQPDAALVDVRTSAEWSFVGVADLDALNKTPIFAQLQLFPTMERNPAFVDEVAAGLKQAGWKPGAPVFFLCRSGARSKAAAIALTANGMTPCYNVAAGFEGDLDGARHRGTQNGWKAASLAWRQS